MNEFIWSEIYRPRTVKDTILPEGMKAIFQGYVDHGNVPNIILAGPPGIGKTTIAKAMLEELNCDVMVVPASIDRGIDTLRNDITQFASTVSFSGGRKYVILDEADFLNPSSTQPGLRNVIDEYADNCFAGKTKIPTIEYGSIEFEKIVGETVTVKSLDGKWRKVTIKEYGKQKLYKIKFGKFNSSLFKNLHQEVIATSNHRWFLSDGSVTTNIKVGDKLLKSSSCVDKSLEGIIHGMIFGDGTGHKSYNQDTLILPKQGDKYSSIRLCKQDSTMNIMFNYLIDAGYTPNYPPSAHGDPVFQLGFKPYIKDLPFTTDPEYIAGFIYGWWLADGKKTYKNNCSISTINKEAIDWLFDYAVYAGYTVTGLNSRKAGSGGYDNSKELYSITLSNNYEPCVRDIEYYDEDTVYCLTEPVTSGFILSNNITTGNCGFIMTCNYKERIIPALHSRNPIVEIKISKEDKPKMMLELYRRIEYILNDNSVPFDKDVVLEIIKKFFPDFRRTLNELQKYAAGTGRIDSGILNDLSAAAIKALIELMKKKNFTAVRKWVSENSDQDQVVLFRAFYDNAAKYFTTSSIPMLILIIGKYQYQAAFVADAEVNLAAFMAECMIECEFL